ncbi:Something about silencing protein [Nesidiocoris tenuis]|uniref:Something about silencing protein n=1 Tax=Nesidiocoris tenuis TaxID=355587 RepID=A0ABN7B9L7_9HEMI|nr:Something about silencing protein [Nesidiocoris tenuis]
MKKKMRKGGKPKNPDADLDRELDHFDVTESDDGLDADDRILIDNARGRRINDEEEEVFRVYESEDDDEDEDDAPEDDGDQNIGSEMDSDMEDKNEDDDLPNSKAWGSKKQDYYNTDYVDQDYLGFDDEENALMEEREASQIQKRLLTELEGADFTLGLLTSVEQKKEEVSRRAALDFDEEAETVAKDLSKLSKQELLDILKRESPGFLELMDITQDYCKKMTKYVIPMYRICLSLKVPRCPALRLLKAYKDCCTVFMMNVSFFVNIKLAQTSNSDRHPVVKTIGQYLTLLRMMDSAMKDKGMLAQMKALVKASSNGTDLEKTQLTEESVAVSGKNRAERRKKKLQLLEKKKTQYELAVQEKKKKLTWSDDVEVNTISREIKKQLETETPKMEIDFEDDGADDGEGENDNEDDKDAKRPITYQMMKNKGLTPKRRKEMRNPRVKNKKKFKKAVKNRRGQVREVRKETSKYGGEISGINKFVCKSVKLR